MERPPVMFRVFFGILLANQAMCAGQVLTNPTASFPVRYGETPVAMRDMVASRNVSGNAIERPRLVVPRPDLPFQTDQAIQSESIAMLTVPSVVESFDGLGQGFVGPRGEFVVQRDPPDTNIAAGKIQIVETVNLAFAVYDKTQKKWVGGPTDLSSLWGNVLPDCVDDGDPIVLYDNLAERWIISQIGGLNYQDECVAVSETADATGKYYLYEFKNLSPLTDYPKLSVWPDAYYLTTNGYTADGVTFLGPDLCALDRSKMVVGERAVRICFNPGTAFDTVLSSDLDGSTPPPSGTPNYMIAVDNNTRKDLAEWRFHVDFAKPRHSTLTGPVLIPVIPFNGICPKTFDCVPQKGTTQRIDALGNFVMFRLAYRNFGSYESLTAVHTVATSPSDTQTGERWYEIREPGSSHPAVYQQATWAIDAAWRFAGSIAQDKDGNILLGYSVSSSKLEPSIRYTGRLATDPLNKMEPEASIMAGTGYSWRDRWGDYSSMVVDPSDECTFWYANEYQTQNGFLEWHTRIVAVKWSSCNSARRLKFR
jgi:hypothetical protein